MYGLELDSVSSEHVSEAIHITKEVSYLSHLVASLPQADSSGLHPLSAINDAIATNLSYVHSSYVRPITVDDDQTHG